MAAPASPRRGKASAGAMVARTTRRGLRVAAARLRARPVAAAALGALLVAACVVWGVLAGGAGDKGDREDPALLGVSAEVAVRRGLAAMGAKGGVVGNKFCVMQPTLSAGREVWGVGDVAGHVALRAFLRTFVESVTEAERGAMRFAIYYGHDSDDAVFGDATLRKAFEDAAWARLRGGGFSERNMELVFTPLYGLHGRVNAIWNTMVKDAYYDGCDYFFMSNDDMVFFTRGWVTSAVSSLDGVGSPPGKKRPCRHLGTVRFKDEWASWATFTFHVSTRLHVEIFGGTYYPVPYNSSHNDYWIHYVYKHFDASKYRGEVRVRNRVVDVDYALAHQKDTQHVAPPRYEYDKKGDVFKYIRQGRARVQAWLDENRHTDRCLPPL